MGRPRNFVETHAIEAAMGVFWERGYAAASLDHLCTATGLMRGSLYQAFDSKHALFMAALERYSSTALAGMDRALASGPTPLDGIRSLLDFLGSMACSADDQRGCLIANASLELVPEDAEVSALIARHADGMAARLEAALSAAQREGQLSPSADPSAIASLILCWINGSRIVAKTASGRKRARASLELLVNTHLRQV